MHKTKILFTFFIFLILAVFKPAAAVDSLSARLSQPKTPTNQNSFNINVVVLDIDNRAVTVKCFKKSPTDAGFSQFGSDINLSAGGNSTNCQVNSSIIGSEGTYEFYAGVTAGSDSVDTNKISVEYKTGGPETPTEYSKEKNSCVYKIKFKTADDGGKTSKVEIYRNENTSFNTDSGTRVGTVSIGSNTNGEYSDGVPDCNKTYYYAIRAFDSIGNGSGTRGDSEVHTTTTTSTTVTTPSPTPRSAIASGTTGNVLGESTTGGKTGDQTGEVMGESTPSAETSMTPTPSPVEFKPTPTPTPSGALDTIKNNPAPAAGILGIIIAIIYYVIFRQPKP